MDDKEIMKIAVKNALEHDGKASEGAVFSKAVGADKSLLGDIKSSKQRVSKIVGEVNTKGKEQLQEEAEELGVDTAEKPKEQKLELKALPGAEKGVVLRLPPEPSGYMHLGHAITFLINYLYREKYGGKLWLRFEDTNPLLLKEIKTYVDSFENGLKWLGVKWDEKKFISSDMEVLYRYGEKLIRESKAYVCKCSVEEITENRLKGIDCKHRTASVGENLELWALAKGGAFEHGEAVVRFKGHMKSVDLALRDPAIFRVIKEKGSQYALWPIYDFASVVEDSLCKITHILRSNEFKIGVQDALRKSLGLEKPIIVQYGRYNFKGTPFSKRKIRALIKAGDIPDWNDIRLPTVSAIMRRGIKPEALREFVLSVGYSSSQHEYSWDLLFTLNRRLIDDGAKRLFFVSNPKKLKVNGAAEKSADIPMHPSKDLGFRTIKTKGNFYIDEKDFKNLKAGDKIRLKDLYSVKITGVRNDAAEAELLSEKMLGDEKIIQWVTDENVGVEVLVVGPLLNEDDSFNKESLKKLHGLAEMTIGLLNEGDTIQFERFGFCRLDNKERNSFIYISR